jgi:hypothetical protein
MNARRTMLRTLAAAVALACLSAAPGLAAEFIHSFDSDAALAKNGDLTVTETIRVRAEHSAIRHGIYRDFPLMFRDAAGNLHEVPFGILSLTRDARPEPYHTERLRNFIRIYAGAKDKLVSYGDHTYVLRYRTGRQVRWFEGKPELNWNVTGNFWNFPIYAARYRLHLANSERPLRWTAYTGRLGARGIDWQGSIGADGVLTVLSTRVLRPGEGLTVVAELPAAAVDPPTAGTLLWYQLFDYRRWVFGGLGFLLVLGYYLAAWERVGRDPKAGVIIPLFHPPTGVSPALANYIRDWGFGREKWRAFTAAALSLAVRGLVRFNKSDEALTLEATGKKPDGGVESLPAGERVILSWVNEMGAATIDEAHGGRVAKVGLAFTKSIEAESRNRFFRKNFGFVVAGLVMTALVAFGIFTLGGLSNDDVGLVIGLTVAAFAGTMIVAQLAQTAFGGGGIRALPHTIMTVAVVLVMLSAGLNMLQGLLHASVREALPMLRAAVGYYPFPLVLVTAFAALNGLFVYLLRAPTALGRPIMDQLKGFRLYLETAEADRLNYQAAPEITADRFEALLPYAVALDVEKPWAHAFEAALRRAHPEDPDPMRHYRPGWVSGSGSTWSSGDFGGAVASTVGGVSAAFASAVPASSGSSGFGGGGGSGGGGGGGGGGGW